MSKDNKIEDGTLKVIPFEGSGFLITTNQEESSKSSKAMADHMRSSNMICMYVDNIVDVIGFVDKDFSDKDLTEDYLNVRNLGKDSIAKMIERIRENRKKNK